MNFKRMIRTFVVFLLVLIVAGFVGGYITLYTGFTDPTLPMIGAVPVIGALLVTIIYMYWAKKEV
jgi:membrane associated rhomboid family serine protease